MRWYGPLGVATEMAYGYEQRKEAVVAIAFASTFTTEDDEVYKVTLPSSGWPS